jgi:TPR repeat protein
MKPISVSTAVSMLLIAASAVIASAQTVGYNPNYYHPVAPIRSSQPTCGHYGMPACPPDPNAPRTTADAPDGMTGDQLVAYSNDQLRRGDKIGALKTLERAAAEGNLAGMRGAGMAYVYGQAGVTDVPRGMAYLEQAAATGDSVALFHLGHLYEEGTVVAADETKAIRYLNASAQKRFWFAEFLLALDYTVGRGVPANRATALNYMTRAAQDTRQETPSNYLAFLRKSGARHWTSVKALSDDYFADYAKIHTPPPMVYGPITPGSPEWTNRITGNSPACHGPSGSAAAFCPR